MHGRSCGTSRGQLDCVGVGGSIESSVVDTSIVDTVYCVNLCPYPLVTSWHCATQPFLPFSFSLWHYFGELLPDYSLG